MPQVSKLREEFGLERVVLMGDRGMIPQKAIGQLRELEGFSWITALKSSQIRSLVEGEALQLGLFDQRRLFELTHEAYPGERLIACRNPELAKLRAHKRQPRGSCATPGERHDFGAQVRVHVEYVEVRPEALQPLHDEIDLCRGDCDIVAGLLGHGVADRQVHLVKGVTNESEQAELVGEVGDDVGEGRRRSGRGILRLGHGCLQSGGRAHTRRRGLPHGGGRLGSGGNSPIWGSFRGHMTRAALQYSCQINGVLAFCGSDPGHFSCLPCLSQMASIV